MDNKKLADEIRHQFSEMRKDIREDNRILNEKLDNYQERLVKVESTLGFIRSGLGLFVAFVSSAISYILYEYFNIGSK